MNFRQHILSCLLKSGRYLAQENLRPDEIQYISKCSFSGLIQVTCDYSSLESYDQSISKSKPILQQEKKEQYNLICTLLSHLNHDDYLKDAPELEGLTPSHIHKLKNLSYAQIIDMANNSDSDIVNFNLDKRILDTALFLCQKQNKRTETIEALIKAGATKNFMNAEYNVPPQKYCFLRSAFKLKKAFGRPRVLTAAEARKVYSIWRQNQHLKVGEAYLVIHKEMNETSVKEINIRNIVTAVQEIKSKTA